ncbi:hypothetical protein JCM33374_g1442 [Metschnikowia sp. JCM 33374]|nr:hypothetical protein JCM33374_g1442 [Metschnikowia sp. JCM 33374]
MKFGKNLAHLSIPEWKDYNLDYNELKKHIREATQAKSPDLRALRKTFVENFDCLDLFIITKQGELTRKLKSDAREFTRIKESAESPLVKLECLDSLHYKFINEVSIELRKLNKFILVQKIAVKKIFKKFAKHYPDENASAQFIASLNKTLHRNRASFMNFDSSDLTARLSDLLLDVDHESKLLHDSLQRKPPTTGPGKLKKNHSASSVGSPRTSVFSSHSAPEDVNLDVNFDLEISSTARFDLITALKKNFAVHSLIPRDVVSRNDVELSMDVYLNIPKVAETFRSSVVYLCADSSDECPSWIISYEDSPVSTVIAYTGGLRKYSYCCLPNSVVNNLLGYLNRNSGDGNSEAAKEKFAHNIALYLQDENLPYMTKSAIEYLLQSGTAPALRLVMDRTYFLHKGGRRTGPTSSSAKPDNLSISPLSAEYQSAAPSVDDNKVYEDSFYMTLDEHIYTSCHIPNEMSFDVASMDPFPFNTFSIYSNDSNLHNFETSLTTEIQGNVLQNKYRAITLKRLPVKIQNFLKTTSVQLFKDFCIFDYMRSCYFNVIPQDPNNHYSRLLNINLFKSYENMDAINDQHDVDGVIIQDKSRIILNRQMSYKSLREIESTVASQKTSGTPQQSYNPANPFENVTELHLQKLADLDNYNEEGNEDSYVAYLELDNDLEDNFLNNVVVSFIRFKYRAKKLLGVPSHDASTGPFADFYKSDPYKSDPYNISPYGREGFYDSINEDTTFLDKSNDYQVKLVHDYDYVLSLLYFSLCFSSIFISGINIGILYSLSNMVKEGTKFNFLDNFLVIVLLTFGFLFSLAFSMTSINLNFQRFEASPSSHSSIVWAGFILVILTVMWSAMCIIP